MATRYWVSNGTTSTGLFSDTAHWSTSSGGAGGASVPGVGDTGIFDSNSSTTFYTVSLTANVTLTSIALDGLSTANRLLIQSSVLGTARTLTCAVASASYVDFRDIIGAGAGPWNLSAITGGSGQCGGNGGITFTTAKNLYWYQTVTGVAYISDATKWFNASGGTGGAGRVPLPQDTCFFNASSFTVAGCEVVQDTPRIGGVDWTGATNTPRYDTNTVSGAVDFEVFGSFRLIAGMNSGSLLGYVNFSLSGRGSYVFQSAGQIMAFPHVNLTCPGGTYTQADNCVFGWVAGSANSIFNPLSGTWNANTYDFDATCLDSTYFGATNFVSSGVNPNVGMSSGTCTLTGNDTLNNNPYTFLFGAVGSFGSSGTVIFTDSTANTKSIRRVPNFVLNLAALELGGSGTGSFILSGPIYSASVRISCTGACDVNLADVNSPTYNTIDFTGFVGSWIGTTNVAFATSMSGSGFLYLSSTMTVSFTGALNATSGTLSGTYQITTNGKQLGSINFGSNSSSWTKSFVLNDDLVLRPGNSITLSAGTFDANNFNVTAFRFTSNNAIVRTLNMGSGTWTMNGSGSAWNVGGSNMTLSASTSTIDFTAAGSTTFFGGGKTYSTVYANGMATFNIANDNTFDVLKGNSSLTQLFRFISGSTQTITSAAGWQLNGTATKIHTLNSSSAGVQFNLSCASGTINGDYLSIKDSNATGGATWNAGATSSNAGNNTGWIFGGSTSSNFFIMF